MQEHSKNDCVELYKRNYKKSKIILIIIQLKSTEK